MNKRVDIEIEKALESVDGIGRSNAPLYFYTRLQGRMQEAERFSSRQLKWSIAIVSLLAILNIFSFINFSANESEGEFAQADALELLAEEYYIAPLDAYDIIENDEE